LSQQEVERLIFCWRLGTPIAECTAIFEEGRRLAEEAGDVRAQAALHGTYGCALGRYPTQARRDAPLVRPNKVTL